jgi:hypothetical protein
MLLHIQALIFTDSMSVRKVGSLTSYELKRRSNPQELRHAHRLENHESHFGEVQFQNNCLQ